MTGSLGLTFGNLIAHFIPGAIVVSAIGYLVVDTAGVDVAKAYVKDYPIVLASVGSLISLSVGLLLDSARYLVTWLPKICKCYRSWISYDLSQANEDDRKYHDWVIESHFRFHQFYGNLFMSLLVSAGMVAFADEEPFRGFYPVLTVCAAIAALSAGFTYHRTIIELKSRFNHTKET